MQIGVIALFPHLMLCEGRKKSGIKMREIFFLNEMTQNLLRTLSIILVRTYIRFKVCEQLNSVWLHQGMHLKHVEIEMFILSIE